MPIYNKRNVNGPYFQYGKTGFKYYYKPYSAISRGKALGKCKRQAEAIHANKFHH